MTPSPRLAVLLAALAAPLAVPMPALACSIVACGTPVRLFATDAGVPGNLVYFKVLQEPVTLTLTAAGAAIAGSIRTLGGERVFVPDAPIAAGTQVRLEWSYTCDRASPSQQLSGQYYFSTSAAVNLELQPLEPKLLATGIESAATEPPRSVGYTRIGYENLPYAHLVDWTFEVDGKRISPDPPKAEASSATISAPCEGTPRGMDSCGRWHEFTPGTHVLKTSAHVVGAPTQPEPVQIDVVASCEPPALARDGGVKAMDAGARAVDAGAQVLDAGLREAGAQAVVDAAGLDAGGGTGRTDATVSAPFVPSTEGETLDEGCRLASGRGDAAGALMLLGLVWRRKRRADRSA